VKPPTTSDYSEISICLQEGKSQSTRDYTQALAKSSQNHYLPLRKCNRRVMRHQLEIKWFHSFTNNVFSREFTYKGYCARDVKVKGSSNLGFNQISVLRYLSVFCTGRHVTATQPSKVAILVRLRIGNRYGK
jgi:hypothetical protein